MASVDELLRSMEAAVGKIAAARSLFGKRNRPEAECAGWRTARSSAGCTTDVVLQVLLAVTG